MQYGFGVVPHQVTAETDVFLYDERSFKMQAFIGTVTRPYEYITPGVKFQTELTLVPCTPFQVQSFGISEHYVKYKNLLRCFDEEELERLTLNGTPEDRNSTMLFVTI